MNARFFRKLDETEEKNFRLYARGSEPDMKQWGIYHPVCRDEWVKLGFKPPIEEGNK